MALRRGEYKPLHQSRCRDVGNIAEQILPGTLWQFETHNIAALKIKTTCSNIYLHKSFISDGTVKS